MFKQLRCCPTVPPVYRDAFRRKWFTRQELAADSAQPSIDEVIASSAIRESIHLDLFDPDPQAPVDYIFRPFLHPSVVPYILSSFALGQLLRQEVVLQGTNAVAYINSLIIYATIASRYLRDPTDAPSNHLAQLGVLSRRVETEGRKVRERGRTVGDPTGRECREALLETTGSVLDWSFHAFRVLKRRIEMEGQTYPRLRQGGV